MDHTSALSTVRGFHPGVKMIGSRKEPVRFKLLE
jgi:hypothetical protein